MRAKIDPIEYRLKLLGANAKELRSALTLLQEKSSLWSKNLPLGHA